MLAGDRLERIEQIISDLGNEPSKATNELHRLILEELREQAKQPVCSVREWHPIKYVEQAGCDNEISITIHGQEQVAVVMKALRDAGFVTLEQAKKNAEWAVAGQAEEWRTVIVGLPIIRKLLNGEDVSLETFKVSLIPDDVLWNNRPLRSGGK